MQVDSIAVKIIKALRREIKGLYVSVRCFYFPEKALLVGKHVWWVCD